MRDAEELQRENDALRDELNRLTDHVERLEDEKTDLERELERSVDDIEALKSEKARLEHEHEELQYEHDQLRETYVELHTDVGSVVRQVLEHSEQVDPDALSSVYAQFVVETEILSASLVASHPSATPELWRWMILYNSKAGAPAVANIHQALEDEGVREALLARSKNPRHWARCCLHVEGEELVEVFQRTVDADPRAAAWALGESPEIAATLGEDQLLPLLQSEEAEVRRRALMAAEHIGLDTNERDAPSPSR